MSDLRPSDLTAEERAIVDRIAMNFAETVALWKDSYSYAMGLAEPAILARRALFAPAKDKPCPKCGALVTYDHLQRVSSDGAEHYVCPKPAPPSEMPEAVSNAAMKLRHSARYCERDGYPSTASEEREIADALESWWRSQPAPAVAMTPELEMALSAATAYALAQWNDVVKTNITNAIAAVRAQASQQRIERSRERLSDLSKALDYGQRVVDEVIAAQPQGVKLPKVREALIFLSGCVNDQVNMGKVVAALAELDTVEGRKP